MEVVLVKYQGRNWNSHVKILPDLPELFPICFTSDTSENLTVDLYAHMSQMAGRLIISIFSPYWIINKTARVLQYRAEDIHVKHPSDFRDVILFSFKKKNLFSKNKVSVRRPQRFSDFKCVMYLLILFPYIAAALRLHQLLVRWLFSGYSGKLWVCPMPR